MMILTVNARVSAFFHICLQGSGAGTFAVTPSGGYNDAQWHYIRVYRAGPQATMTDQQGNQLARVLRGNNANHSPTYP